MELRVNGEATRFEESDRLAALLARYDVNPGARGVAVAVNDVVVPSARWETTKIEDGDTIEIIRAVQGG